MLDDLRRALRMDSPSPRLSESNLRKLSRGLRSSKKSRLSVHSSLETQSVQDGNLGNRSVSLSTLLPSGGGGGPGSVPRVDKLQTLEAKMVSIEMSLGWRRRREALLETLPRAARELVRELDTLHQAVREKENCIQGLRTQITNLGGTVAGVSDGAGGIVSESERKTIRERLAKVEAEIEAKKVAVKNLKLTLDKIDITDNIDVRIRAAELEYELEREELNILNLKEEASVLTTRLQESCLTPQLSGGNSSNHPKTRVKFQEMLMVPGNSTILSGVSLVSASVSYTPGNPPFHVTCKPPYGCVIDWATDDTRLKKGDRLIEINGEVVIGQGIEDVTKIMSSTPNLSLVVARPFGDNGNGIRKVEKQIEDKIKESKELAAKLDKALKERESFKNDNTRLSHRISYLEDQVNELQSTLQRAKDEAIISGSPNEILTPSHPGATIIQVFQKGPQTMAVAGAEFEKSENRVQEYPTLPRLKSPSCSSRDSGSNNRIDEIEEETQPPKVTEINGTSPPSAYETKHFEQQVASITSTKQIVQNNSQLNRTKRSSDDYNDYQTVNIHLKPDSVEDQKYRRKSDDYDCIEKLRDKLTEKSPSYSYGTPNDCIEEKKLAKYEAVQQSSSDYEYLYSENLYGYTRLVRDKEKMNGSKAFNREDHLLSSNLKEGEGRASRSINSYEMPSRRVVSPGVEDIRPMRPRPIPPKKPERLSLHRTTSMQSVEESRSCSRASTTSTPSRILNTKNGYLSSENIYCGSDINSSHNGHIINSQERSSNHENKLIYESENGNRLSKLSRRIEENYPTPSPRNISQNNRRTSSQNSKEPRRLTISSIDSVPNYESPYAKHSPYILNGHHSYTRSKSPESSLHLDASLGLDLHEDVRAQPLHEFIHKSPESPSNLSKNQRLVKHLPSKGKDKDSYEAPPTPSTPPRGINLSMKNSGKAGEEWC